MTDAASQVSTPVTEAPKKKGNASWKPREDVQVKRDPNYDYRWVAADENRIATLMNQGYEVCSALNGEGAFKGRDADKRTVGGHTLDTVLGDRDRILMRLHKDAAKQRNAYFEKKAKKQVSTIASKADGETGVKTTGDITINGAVVNEIID